MGSRLPRAFTRRTQKPLSSLWNVTRSTRPAKTSVVGLLFAAIDCLTRSSPEHLRLRIFFHNRDKPRFNPGMGSISEGFVRLCFHRCSVEIVGDYRNPIQGRVRLVTRPG